MRSIHSSLLVVSLLGCAAASASCTTSPTGASPPTIRSPEPRASAPAADVRWFKAPAGAREIKPCFLGRGATGRFGPGVPGFTMVVVGISPAGRGLFRKRIDPSGSPIDIDGAGIFDGPLTIMTYLMPGSGDSAVPCQDEICNPPPGPPNPPCDPAGH
jgi:hypothetical protein